MMRLSIKTSVIAAFFAVMAVSAATWAATCPGIVGGMGIWYDSDKPLLQITYNRADGKVYATEDFGAGQVYQLTYGATATVYYNGYPYDIVTDQSTGLMYVSLRQAAGVVVLNTAGQTVRSIAVGNNPSGMAISTLTKRLYVANASTNNVSVVDINSASPSYLQVIKTIDVGRTPMEVAVDDAPGYGRVYVSNREGYTLSIINETTLKVVGGVALSFKPGEIAVNTSTHKIYVVNSANTGGPITVVNANSTPVTVQTTITTGTRPWGVAVNPNTNRIYVTDYTSMTVTVLHHDDPPDGTSYSTVRVDTFTSPLRGIYVDPVTDYYYAASETGYSTNGLAGCDRQHLAECIEMRKAGTVDDAAVEAFVDCYFHQ